MREFRYGLIIGLLTAAVIGLGLLLVFGSNSDEKAGTNNPGTPKQKTSDPKTPAEKQQLPTTGQTGEPASRASVTKDFRTPTRNIVCSVRSDGVSCGIKEFTYEVPPVPDDCGLAGWGQFFGVKKDGLGQIQCADGIPADPWSPVLQYGDMTRAGRFECQSAETGIRCLDIDTGHGFDLSRESYSTF